MRIQGLGTKVCGVGFRVQSLGSRFWSLGFRFRIEGFQKDRIQIKNATGPSDRAIFTPVGHA